MSDALKMITPTPIIQSNPVMTNVNNFISINIVPMKLYANWEADRTSNSTIQRVLTMTINKIQLSKLIKQESNFSIAVRLKGHKRTLRSNDISVPTINNQTNIIEINVDISFTIQYCHFLKRKTNILQILLQRRKRYKNRHIPGFKTLAVGYLNLDEILQMSGSREIRTWNTSNLNKNDVDLNDINEGIIYISGCQTQALENDGSYKNVNKEGMTLSEEDDDDLTEESDYELDHPDYNGDQTSRYRQQIGKQRRIIKTLNQKNIKSKLSALIKRFKVQEGGAGPSRVRLPPTQEELEEIFEELENISDSGPELEPDKMSIISNPKPGLRPFFGSKSDLPPIEDSINFDESGPESEEIESSSENENNQLFFMSDFSSTVDTPKDVVKESVGEIKEPQQMVSTINRNYFSYFNDSSIDYSLNTNKKSHEVNYFDDINLSSNIWLCCNSDIPWISKIDVNEFKYVKLINCLTINDIKSILQTMVSKIQKFCNSNSEQPPQTIIGVLGGDKFIVNILRIYVELLQNKTAQEWLNYLRFSLLVPPNSVVGRTLAMIADCGLMDIQWKALNKINSNDINAIEECLLKSHNKESLKSLNLPIGEVMIQFSNNITECSGEIINDSQIFIPFISEIHLGNLDELNSLHYVKKDEEESNITSTTSDMSPPLSPQITKNNEWKELQIEYWTSNEMPNYNEKIGHTSIAQKTTTNIGKFSMKASVRTLSIAKEPLSSLLSMIFVKERKKDKVLQKLGRKAKTKSIDNFNLQSRVVSNVTRMICSSKNAPLEISIDGVTWNKIRFFQITSQWQTHVKFLPILVLQR